jgi:putative FmdB family regulatory protein
MPIYEYQCKKCHHRFERIQKFSDAKIKKCPDCGGPVEELLNAPAVQFKGSGWYVTDYARKSGDSHTRKHDKKESAKESNSSSDGSSKTESSSKAESKSESESKKDKK